VFRLQPGLFNYNKDGERQRKTFEFKYDRKIQQTVKTLSMRQTLMSIAERRPVKKTTYI